MFSGVFEVKLGASLWVMSQENFVNFLTFILTKILIKNTLQNLKIFPNPLNNPHAQIMRKVFLN
jgi:hypothetical protein